MIQKQDLRIGNSVMYDNRVFQIAAISDEFPMLNTAEFGIGVVDWNNIHPIPITKEALKDMKFEQDIFGDYANENIYELLLQIDLISCRISVNSDDRRVDFEGIHNLQNYVYTNYQTELIYEPTH